MLFRFCLCQVWFLSVLKKIELHVLTQYKYSMLVRIQTHFSFGKVSSNLPSLLNGRKVSTTRGVDISHRLPFLMEPIKSLM